VTQNLTDLFVFLVFLRPKTHNRNNNKQLCANLTAREESNLFKSAGTLLSTAVFVLITILEGGSPVLLAYPDGKNTTGSAPEFS
jgi:hypothetical protein